MIERIFLFSFFFFLGNVFVMRNRSHVVDTRLYERSH